jgi:hypothetical protein
MSVPFHPPRLIAIIKFEQQYHSRSPLLWNFLQRPGICLELYICYVGRDSSVGIATRYELDRPRIKFRWGREFLAPVQTGPGVYPASSTIGTGSFPGVKRPGRGVDHSPPSSAEVKKKIELYLYSPSGTLWPVLGWVLPLPYICSPYTHLWCQQTNITFYLPPVISSFLGSNIFLSTIFSNINTLQSTLNIRDRLTSM